MVVKIARLLLMSAGADQVLDCDQDGADALHLGATSPSRRAAEVIEYIQARAAVILQNSGEPPIEVSSVQN